MFNLILVLVTVTLAMSFSCAHHNKSEDTEGVKSVNREAQEQPLRNNHGEIAMKGYESIQNSPSLTEQEKEQLMEVHARMMKDTFMIQDETSKLKGVLFETITTKPYNAKKVGDIKKRLIQLNDQKMKNMFHAVEEVEKIVGNKSGDQMKEIFRPFLVDQTQKPTNKNM